MQRAPEALRAGVGSLRAAHGQPEQGARVRGLHHAPARRARGDRRDQTARARGHRRAPRRQVPGQARHARDPRRGARPENAARRIRDGALSKLCTCRHTRASTPGTDGAQPRPGARRVGHLLQPALTRARRRARERGHARVRASALAGADARAGHVPGLQRRRAVRRRLPPWGGAARLHRPRERALRAAAGGAGRRHRERHALAQDAPVAAVGGGEGPAGHAQARAVRHERVQLPRNRAAASGVGVLRICWVGAPCYKSVKSRRDGSTVDDAGVAHGPPAEERSPVPAVQPRHRAREPHHLRLGRPRARARALSQDALWRAEGRARGRAARRPAQHERAHERARRHEKRVDPPRRRELHGSATAGAPARRRADDRARRGPLLRLLLRPAALARRARALRRVRARARGERHQARQYMDHHRSGRGGVPRPDHQAAAAHARHAHARRARGADARGRARACRVGRAEP